MTKSKLMVALAVVSFGWLATTVVLAGIFYPNYSHLSQFMSELGATGSPHGPFVNLLGFAITEVLLLCSFAIAWQFVAKDPMTLIGFVLLVAYPVSILVAALSPCDFSCRPENPTLSHTIHIIFGLLAYLCAALGLAVLSWQDDKKSKSPKFRLAAIALTPILLLMLFNLTPENPYVGAVQRISEIVIYVWLIFWLIALANRSDESANLDN